MSAIDIQNSRQIRDPMDVLITLSLGTDIAMTYSGYSSAKVADGVLNQSSWPMRGLADLQGNGFPLDGSRVLYNPNTSPSQTNGKLGVRGNVGQPVSVTATGNDTIAALAITVTGAASVTLNGETTEITGNHVTLQLLNTTAALTFQPSSEDRRVEIITVLPEADFVINNDNLIKATVSLRSDLSIINPTLPESELNVEVYQDLDISEAVVSIPEDTPITYQAGYPGDMSPVRKFYVSGQVTWADNVLKIQAVDAVHFLDKEIMPSSIGFYNDIQTAGSEPSFLAIEVAALLTDAGVSFADVYFPWSFYRGSFSDTDVPRSVIEGGRTYKDVIAQIVNLAHFDDLPATYFRPRTGLTPPKAYWINYVDAGRPRLSREKPSARRTVLEEDVAEFKRNVEPVIAKIIAPNKTANPTSGAEPAINSNSQVGTIDWRKNDGAYVSFDDNVARFTFGLSAADGVTPVTTNANVLPIIPCTANGRLYSVSGNIRSGFNSLLYNSETQQRAWNGSYDGVQYTQIVPWAASFRADESHNYRWRTQAQAWAGLVSLGIIPADADSAQLKIFGSKVILNENETEYSVDRNGVTALPEKGWAGRVGFYTSDTASARMAEALPKMGYESLLKRSNITCSFTWKGDPRIQPRDVFTFHRLDGTDEEWTFENITITHEGGGTSAEITARKGIV